MLSKVRAHQDSPSNGQPSRAELRGPPVVVPSRRYRTEEWDAILLLDNLYLIPLRNLRVGGGFGVGVFLCPATPSSRSIDVPKRISDLRQTNFSNP